VKIAPRILTDALVTNPAKINVKPKARTIGHAVGAGSAIESGRCTGIPSVSDAIFQSFLHRPIT
jgi:hypothetical protein